METECPGPYYSCSSAPGGFPLSLFFFLFFLALRFFLFKNFLFYLFIFNLKKIYLFYLLIFGCVGSLLLCAGFLYLQRAGATLC